ncbi:MAG: hypothetical protein ACU85U_16830 [Gammaproteobacteria bacterium]
MPHSLLNSGDTFRTEGHYAWDTRFGVAGYRGNVGHDVTFVTQVLYGVTIGGRRLTRTGKHLNESPYFAGYGLLARQIGQLSYAVRDDYFAMWAHDRMRFIYDGAENGYAVTLAASYKPQPTSKITAELQYLDHAREVRVYGGQSRHIDEFTFRLHHRWFFRVAPGSQNARLRAACGADLFQEQAMCPCNGRRRQYRGT